MAFDATKMVLIGHGAGLKVYFYDAGADTMATVKAADYFNGFVDQLAVKDLVYVVANDGQFWQRCSANDGSTVTMASLSSAVVLTDSSGGSASDTIAAIEASYTQATIRDAFASLTAKVNKILRVLGET